MRLASLNEFRRRVFTARSAPSVASLRRQIDRGRLIGGFCKGGKYLVDLDVFVQSAPGSTIEPRPKLQRQLRARLASPAALAEWKKHYASIKPELRDRALRASAAHSRKRKRRIQIATPLWADLAAIKAIFEEARRITKETGVPHSVDHEIPLHGRLVSGLHVETNLRIVTSAENSRKHNYWHPDEIGCRIEAQVL